MPENSPEYEEELAPAEALFVGGLFSGLTTPQAAAQAGYSPDHGWVLRRRPRIATAVRRTSDDILASAAHQAATAVTDALRVLLDLMTDEQVSDGVRVRAAVAVTDIAVKLREAWELDERIARLERAAEVREWRRGELVAVVTSTG